MVIFIFIFMASLLGDLGFFIIVVLTYFYLIYTYYGGLFIRLSIRIDFIRFGMLFLSRLIMLTIILAGFVEFYNKLKWTNLLIYLFFLLIFLFFTFRFSYFIIFYLFFEFVVIPTFIVVVRWGYRFNRIQAGLYIFLYTFLSSLPLLFLLCFLWVDGNRIFFYYNIFLFNFKHVFYYWWFFIIFVFIVKLPLFFLHLWLPKAHVDAPLLGSIILAGVLLKMGGYGVYKSMGFFYFYYLSFSWLLSFYSIFGGVIIGILCLRQIDIKRLIAFSSVVHMGPVFCSIILLSYSGLLGSYWIIVSHGFCSACLFFLINRLYKILGSRNLFFLRGGIMIFPFFSFIWFIFCIFNIGFPPSFNFFSEILIMVGSFYYRKILMFFFSFLLLLRGFYNIIIFFFFNHGSLRFYFSNFDLFNLKDIIVLYLFFIYLLFFIFFSFFFC